MPTPAAKACMLFASLIGRLLADLGLADLRPAAVSRTLRAPVPASPLPPQINPRCWACVLHPARLATRGRRDRTAKCCARKLGVRESVPTLAPPQGFPAAPSLPCSAFRILPCCSPA